MSTFEVLLLVMAAIVVAVAFRYLKLGLSWGLGFAAGSAALYCVLRLTVMTPLQAVVTTVFALAYGLIATDRLHKTTVALAGAVFFLALNLVHQHEAFHGAEGLEGIDWNTIFLLIGMMVIINVARHSGLFEWLAIRSAKAARGNPVALVILLSVVTAAISACLDNVTAVLLIAPLAIHVCATLETSPLPLLVSLILASNIGGTATLVGDPPNIMIASSAGLSYLDFLRVDAPVAVLSLGLFALGLWLTLGKRMHVGAKQRAEVMLLDEGAALKNRPLLWRSLAVIGLTLLGFIFHRTLHMEPATAALTGAALMLLMHHEGPEEALREVEWSTIFFFIGLFIMVTGLVKVGVIALMGEGILQVTGGNLFAMTMLVLWFSALASGVVDNIPFVATMAALIHGMARQMHPEAATVLEAAHAADVLPLWWALSLGACLGGNLTLVGASANVIVAGIATRSGHPIGFGRFMRYSLPVTLQGLVLSSLWLWWLFLR